MSDQDSLGHINLVTLQRQIMGKYVNVWFQKNIAFVPIFIDSFSGTLHILTGKSQ